MRGVDALWNEFEKGVMDETETDRSPRATDTQDSSNAMPGSVSLESAIAVIIAKSCSHLLLYRKR
jgi:dihydroorotase-like cyclic amidohydrolase